MITAAIIAGLFSYSVVATWVAHRNAADARSAMRKLARHTSHTAWCAKARLHYSADCTCQGRR